MPRPSTISIELLRTLVKLIDNNGDAMATARQLEINQPSMSKRLRMLQHAGDLLPKPWLVRKGHVWSLTPEGSARLAGIKEIVRRYDQVMKDQNPDGEAVGFACGPTAVAAYVLDAVKEFRRKHPSVTFRLRTPRSSTRVQEVSGGGLDLAEVTQSHEGIQKLANRPLLTWELSTEHLHLAVSRTAFPEAAAEIDALIAAGKTLSAQALLDLDLPLLLPEPGAAARDLFDEGVAAGGDLSGLNAVLEAGGGSTLLAYAREGIGAAVVGRTALSADRRGVVDIPLDRRTFPPTTTRVISRCRLDGDLTDFSDEHRRIIKLARQPKRGSGPHVPDLSPAAMDFLGLLLEKGRPADPPAAEAKPKKGAVA